MGFSIPKIEVFLKTYFSTGFRLYLPNFAGSIVLHASVRRFFAIEQLEY